MRLQISEKEALNKKSLLSITFSNKMLFNAFMLYMKNSILTNTRQSSKFSDNPVTGAGHSAAHMHETQSVYPLCIKEVVDNVEENKEITVLFKKYLYKDFILEKFLIEIDQNPPISIQPQSNIEKGKNKLSITSATSVDIPKEIIEELQAIPLRLQITQNVEESLFIPLNQILSFLTIAVEKIIDYLGNIQQIATENPKYSFEEVNAAFGTLGVYNLFSEREKAQSAILAIKNRLVDFSGSHNAEKGNWQDCVENENYEIGIGNYSGRPALADASYHIELTSDSIKILDKNNKYASLTGPEFRAVALKFAVDLKLLKVKTEDSLQLLQARN